MRYDLAQLQSLSRQAGWDESLIAKAAAIWMYESGGDPNAHNPRGEDSHGLAQINLPFHPTMTVAKARDPITALRYAYKLYRARPNWGDWYNSNKKYNANFQGIAAKSRAIYAAGGGGGSVQVITSVTPSGQPQVTQVPVSTIQELPAPEKSNDYMVYAALGVVFMAVIISRR